MPEPIKKEGEEGGAAEEAAKPVTDVFGTQRDSATGLPVQAPAPKEEAKQELDADGKPKAKVEPKAADDLENNPVVKALRDDLKKVNDDKGSMGKSLSDMRKIVDDTKAELKRIKDGGAAKIEPMFKDIKRVKDLPTEQQEAMTDGEKKLMDQLADTQEAMNKTIAEATTKEAAEKSAAEAAATEAEDTATFTKDIQTRAIKMASGDVRVANAIIAEFNTFADNDKLDEAGRDERLAKAAKLVPDYKPPAEQKGPAGKAAGAAKDADANGVDKIVQEVAAGRTGGGTYSL